MYIHSLKFRVSFPTVTSSTPTAHIKKPNGIQAGLVLWSASPVTSYLASNILELSTRVLVPVCLSNLPGSRQTSVGLISTSQEQPGKEAGSPEATKTGVDWSRLVNSVSTQIKAVNQTQAYTNIYTHHRHAKAHKRYSGNKELSAILYLLNLMHWTCCSVVPE